jgi:hypothetical protein
VPEAMVESGQTSPPSRDLATIPFTQDSRNQVAPEAMPKSEGRTSMVEPLWTILQNKVANVIDPESSTMQDSNTIIQQEGWTNENDCDTPDSQLSEYGATHILLPALTDPLQRPSTTVRVSEPIDEAPETPKTGNVIQPMVKNYVPPQVTQLSTFERSRLTQYDPLSTFTHVEEHFEHFSHAGATPLGYTELGRELGHTGDTPMSEAILDGTFEHDSLTDEALAAILKQLRKHPNVQEIIQPIVTEADFKSAFKCVPEKTA